LVYVLKDKRKDAVKKVIAAMTVGKDVSSLFTDVVNCMQTENLELKKLVYLYLINYAKSQPDLAILAVNTFVKVKARIAIILSVCVSYFRCFFVSVLLFLFAITNLLAFGVLETI
jgi:AP-1 complex subunit beta-1